MKRLKIGSYQPKIQKKGYEEALIKGIKEGDVFWEVYVGEGAGFDTKRQEDAIIIGLLLKIEQLLKRKKI